MRPSLLIPLLTILCAAAQAQPSGLGYEPPPGWTYVRKMERPEFTVKAKGDTVLIFTGRKPGTDIFEAFVSTDGGLSLDTLRTNFRPGENSQVHNSLVFYRFQTYPTGNPASPYILHFEKSFDLGKTFPFSIPSGAGSPCSGAFRVSEADPAFISYFYKCAFSQGSGQGGYFSGDGGINWHMPDYDSVDLVNAWRVICARYSIEWREDVRQPGIRWMRMENDGGNREFCAQPLHIKSEDNGRSFHFVRSLPEQAGFEFPGSSRWWMYDEKPDRNAVGIYLGNEDGDTITSANWLKRMFPHREFPDPDTNRQTGLLTSSYLYSFRHPEKAVVKVYDQWRDPASNELIKEESYLFRTQNNGESWEEILHTTSLPVFDLLAYDGTNNTVWIRTFDEPYVYERRDVLKSSLWKRSLITSVEDRTDFGSHIVIYPQPAAPGSVLSISLPSGEYSAGIYSVLGEKLSTVVLQPSGDNSFRMEIPGLAPGTYFLRIHSLNFSQAKPLLLAR